MSSRDPSAPGSRLPLLLLSIGVLSVSVSALIARRALEEVAPLMLAAWRMGMAALFFLIVQALRRPPAVGVTAAAIDSRERARLGLAGLALALHFIVWFASLRMTSVSVATLLVCTTPLWTAVGQIALRRSPATREFWAAFAVALIGVGLVIRPAGGVAGVTHEQILGALLAMIGGALYGIYLLAVDGLQHHSSWRIVSWTYTIAAVLLWMIVLVLGQASFRYSLAVWEAIVLLTVVPQIIGHTLINDALKYFQAHIVAFSILAEPVIAAALAVVLLHEVVTSIMLLGGVLVLVALGFVLARSSRRVTVQDIEEL